jgi:acyl-CoA synthetase (AMP-forming)/AMP-acid ligase II
MWRQEDIFFAAMGAGGRDQEPIVAAEELPERLPVGDTARVVLLVVGPLMHGNAQWALWNAFRMGGTAVLSTNQRFDPDELWRIVTDERVVSMALVGDAMARPLAEASATAATFPVDEHGVRWSVPGDLASVEEDGSITVHGRGSASINSGGEKIFPEEVEAAVKSHPGVYGAIVVGVPDDPRRLVVAGSS